jgi:hypothetical protein
MTFTHQRLRFATGLFVLVSASGLVEIAAAAGKQRPNGHSVKRRFRW